MPPVEPPPLWQQALRQSVLGPRGLVKTATLWLPLAVVVTLSPPAIWPRAAYESFLVLAAVACWSLTSILGNDLTDRADDHAARKVRWIQRLRPATGKLVVVLLIGIGAAAVLSVGPMRALLVYLAAVAVGLLYSIRPVRFKERGLLGPLAYALAGALAFAALPWAWFGAPWPALAVLAPAVLLDKWVNLHFHQVVDYEADLEQGSNTYATRVGVQRARQTLLWAADLASLAMVAVLAYLAAELPPSEWIVVAVGAVAAAAVAGYAWLARRRGGRRASDLVRELPPYYLGLTYASFRLVPLLILVRLALAEPALWAAAAAVALSVLIESAYSIRYRYA